MRQFNNLRDSKLIGKSTDTFKVCGYSSELWFIYICSYRSFVNLECQDISGESRTRNISLHFALSLSSAEVFFKLIYSTDKLFTPRRSRQAKRLFWIGKTSFLEILYIITCIRLIAFGVPISGRQTSRTMITCYAKIMVIASLKCSVKATVISIMIQGNRRFYILL